MLVMLAAVADGAADELVVVVSMGSVAILGGCFCLCWLVDEIEMALDVVCSFDGEVGWRRPVSRRFLHGSVLRSKRRVPVSSLMSIFTLVVLTSFSILIFVCKSSVGTCSVCVKVRGRLHFLARIFRWSQLL